VADSAARHRDALEYERICHLAVLGSFASVPEEQRETEDHRRALDLYAHLLESRTRWLGRIHGETDRREDWFPQGWTVDEIARETERVYDTWRSYLAELSDPDLERWLPYTSWEGDAFENRVDDIVVQLSGHSFYHRGQIASLIRRCGGQPAATDYVLGMRRPASTP